MKRFTICIVVLLFQADLTTTSQVFAQQINAIGRVMPADAAPLDQQIFRFFEVDGAYMEWFKTIYKRSPATDLISEPLVRHASSLRPQSVPEPGGAEGAEDQPQEEGAQPGIEQWPPVLENDRLQEPSDEDRRPLLRRH